MCAAFFEGVVHIKGDPRQITEVLQQREERKENCHWRQHHGDDPGQSFIDTIHERRFDESGSMKIGQKGFQLSAQPGKQGCKPLRRIIGACNG